VIHLRYISHYIKLSLSTFLLLFLWIPAVNADKCLLFSDIFQKSPKLKCIGENFKTALKAVDICVEFISLPSKRATLQLLRAELDGALMRATEYKKLVGDVAIMIHEPLISTQGLLISYDTRLTSIDKLIGRNLGIVRGSAWSNAQISDGMFIHLVNYPDQLVQMLVKKRVDAILIDSVTALAFKSELEATVRAEIVSLPGYPWLSVKHKKLVPQIEQAIKEYRAKYKYFQCGLIDAGHSVNE